jgi:hypothetical protein
MENEISISLFIRKDYSPHFLDLSKTHFFDLYLDIKRGPSDTNPRDRTILTNGTVFDIPFSFREGLLELIDEETGAIVLLPPSSGESEKENNFITLPLKMPGPKKTDRVFAIHFNAVDLFKETLIPGRQYKIWLRDLDCHVKWWSFSSPPPPRSALPPSESGKLVAKNRTNKLFHAVSSIRSPPRIDIKLSLDPPIVSENGPLPTLRTTITNLGSKAITIKSSGEQFYVSTQNVNPHDALISSISSYPQVQNFVITSATSPFSTISDIPGSASAGSRACPRRCFTTLEPGVPLVLEGSFWEYGWLRKKMTDDGSGLFRMKLKRREAWWREGTVDELFEERKKEELNWKDFWRDLWKDACLPVVLECEDEIKFRYVG